MNEFSHKRSWGPTPFYPQALLYKRPNKEFITIAGPCSFESVEHCYKMASIVSLLGATHLRSGVFRAGTYPGKNFGWIDNELIKEYHAISKSVGLKNIIEVLEYSEKTMDFLNENCDVFQVGARAQQHYQLLRTLGQYNKPIFLKRNTGCTVDEVLGSCEHLLVGGAKEIYIIERGSSTFHTDVRWAPMPHIIPSIKSICDIPVIMDASHSTGRRDLVPSMTLAGVAAGADGVLIEVHDNPEKSLSDADQAIDLNTFKDLIDKINSIRRIV